MGRMLPVECEHGIVVDWGDFGPDENDGTAGTKPCAECEAQRSRSAHIDIEWDTGSDVPDTVIRDTVENVCCLLMSQLLCMGVTDPCISATLAGRRINQEGE